MTNLLPNQIRGDRSMFARLILSYALLLAAVGCTPSEDSDGPDAGVREDAGLPVEESSFTGKLAFSAPPGWPLRVFNFDTNTFELSKPVDDAEDDIGAAIVQSDLDPTANYLAYAKTNSDGLFAGETTQVVIRDMTSSEEFTLPFETSNPVHRLNSFNPSISANGVIVFERYTEVLGSGDFPVDRIDEGISFWDGNGEPVALATSVEAVRKPRIATDGSVFFIGDNDDGERVIWRTNTEADVPTIVGAPVGDELLSVNSARVFDISDDGQTFVFQTFEGDIKRINYTTPTRSDTLEIEGLLNIGLSGDGTTLLMFIATENSRRFERLDLRDGTQELVLQGSLSDGLFAISAMAVSQSGDAVAMVSSDTTPGSEGIFALHVFGLDGLERKEKVIGDSVYGGITSAALSLRFRGGVK